MITVRELLCLPALRGAKVLTDTIGLGRQVRHVTVMEVPDIKRWLKGDDFLITSFFSVRESEDKQCALLEELRDTCAGIAIKLGHYVKELTPRVLETANRCGIPLLQIPFETTYIDILMSVMNQIMVDEGREEILHRFLADVVYENYAEREIMVERGRLLGMGVVENSFACLCLEPREPGGDLRQLSARARDLRHYLEREADILRCWQTDWNRGVLLLAEGADSQALCRCLRQRLTPAGLHAVVGLDGAAVTLSVGQAGRGLDALRRSYHDAVRARQTGTLVFADRFLYFYEELRTFCCLHDILLRENGDAFAELLSPVENRDMLETIAMYFSCDGDLEQVSSRLFVHKNTVKYRLGRLEKKTGLRLSHPRGNFLLYLAVLAREFQSADSGVESLLSVETKGGE